MRHQTREFVDKFLEKYGENLHSVLEVGSMDVNGNVKNNFKEMKYLGIDIREGSNVDKVMNGHELSKHFPRKEFDIVISFDTFEHDDKFWLTMEEMKKVCKTGGWILIGVPGRNCPYHAHPNDYWRFYPAAVESLMEGLKHVYIDSQKDNDHDEFDEIYAWGQKR
jgi:SAM-dependent methyltransferase